MSMAPQELENSASKYASDAIKADSQGAKGMAIANYQNAIDVLVKITKLYPQAKINQIYQERIVAYKNRITQLQKINSGIEPVVDPNATPEEQKQSLEKKEDDSFEDLIMKEKPDIKWSECIGLDNAKNALRESIVYPSKRPDLFPLGWPRGMLLYGPPGCGKTILAAATANELDGYFITVYAASMMSKWLGEAEKNVSKLFKMARRYAERDNKPVILFVDEVDSLLGERTSEVGGEVRSKNQFLSEMDGVNGKGKEILLYVIGATNKPWSLDPPFLRRFQKRIYVSLPALEAREKLFNLYTAPLNMNIRVNSHTLARTFDGYSASDIRDVCQSAQLKVVNELFNQPDYKQPTEGDELSKPRELVMNDFKEIKLKRNPSVSPDMIKGFHMWSEQYQAL